MRIPGRAAKSRQRRYSSSGNTPVPPDAGDIISIIPGNPLPLGVVYARASAATYFELEGGLLANDNRFVRDAVVDELRDNHWENWYIPTIDPFYMRTFYIEGPRSNHSEFSEDLTNAFWTKNGSTITANDAEAPDESITMDKIVESAVNEEHSVSHDYVLAAGGLSAAIFFRPDERTNVELRIEETATPANFLHIKVDDSTSVTKISLLAAGGTALLTMGNIDVLINGSTRVLLGGTFVSGNITVRAILLDGTGSSPYLGDGVSGGQVWGMQVEQADFPSSYIRNVGGAGAVARAEGFFGANVNPSQVPFSMQISFVERGTILSPLDRYFQVGGPGAGDDPRLMGFSDSSLGVITQSYDDGVAATFIAHNNFPANAAPLMEYMFTTDYMVRFYGDGSQGMETYINGTGPWTPNPQTSSVPGNWANPTTLRIGGTASPFRVGFASFRGILVTSAPDFPLIPTQPPEQLEGAFEDGGAGFHFLSVDQFDGWPSVVNAGAGFAGIDTVEAGSQRLAAAGGLASMDEATK